MTPKEWAETICEHIDSFEALGYIEKQIAAAISEEREAIRGEIKLMKRSLIEHGGYRERLPAVCGVLDAMDATVIISGNHA